MIAEIRESAGCASTTGFPCDAWIIIAPNTVLHTWGKTHEEAREKLTNAAQKLGIEIKQHKEE